MTAVRQTTTAAGVPVVSLWDCPRPDPDQPAAGFPPLAHARHATIYHATREDGAYNHHSQLCWHGGAFHAMWSCHPFGEDGPGQRVLHATSPDGGDWSSWTELFAPPGPIKPSEETGLALTAFRWVPLGDTLYAVAGVHENVGFTDFERTQPPAAVRDKEHPARAREGYAPIARAVAPDGGMGSVFATGDKIHPAFAIPLADDPTDGRLRQANSRPSHLPSWDFEGVFRFPHAAEDGHRLCEPAVFQRPDGAWIMLLRDTAYSHRLYVSERNADTGAWPPARPTNIPDSPSLSATVTLADGTVLLVGNQVAPAFDNADEVRHYMRSPLTVAVSADGKRFTRVYALHADEYEVRFPDIKGRGRFSSGQYPSPLVHDGRLWVQYSLTKEDIGITCVSLADLGIGDAAAEQ